MKDLLQAGAALGLLLLSSGGATPAAAQSGPAQPAGAIVGRVVTSGGDAAGDAQVTLVDLRQRSVRCRAGALPLAIPDGVRQQLLGGTWDATAVLLEAGGAIEATAARLPYVQGFSAA